MVAFESVVDEFFSWRLVPFLSSNGMNVCAHESADMLRVTLEVGFFGVNRTCIRVLKQSECPTVS